MRGEGPARAAERLRAEHRAWPCQASPPPGMSDLDGPWSRRRRRTTLPVWRRDDVCWTCDGFTHVRLDPAPSSSPGQVKHGLSTLPVLGGSGKLTEVVSEADLLRHVPCVPYVPHPPGSVDLSDSVVVRSLRIPVSDVMRPHPITVDPDTDINTATDLMTCTAIRSLAVVRDGELVRTLARLDSSRGPAGWVSKLSDHGRSSRR